VLQLRVAFLFLSLDLFAVSFEDRRVREGEGRGEGRERGRTWEEERREERGGGGERGEARFCEFWWG
jgi:hypothetical protein